jgi:DNA-binding NarL/FixJ family response regulator
VIADDQGLVRGGFRSILGGQPDIDVVGEAGDGAEAVRLCRSLRPDVVLMDIRMPVLDGLAATRQVVDAVPTRVLVLTTFDVDEYVYAALTAGASGFILKDGPAEGLAEAVRTIASGHALLAPTVTRRLIQSYVRGPGPDSPPPPAVGTLTERETAILRAMAAGLSNAEIAAQLYLGESTVKTHVTHVLAKLGVRDRLQAVVYAYENGIVRAGEAMEASPPDASPRRG